MYHLMNSNKIFVLMNVYCIIVTFPCGILGQVWYLIVSFPDLCRLSYFQATVVRICPFKDIHMML